MLGDAIRNRTKFYNGDANVDEARMPLETSNSNPELRLMDKISLLSLLIMENS